MADRGPSFLLELPAGGRQDLVGQHGGFCRLDPEAKLRVEEISAQRLPISKGLAAPPGCSAPELAADQGLPAPGVAAGSASR